jgi:hypothetical protein
MGFQIPPIEQSLSFSLIRLSPSKSRPCNARLGYQAFAFSQLPRRLSSPTNCLALLTCSSLGRFLIGSPALYFTKKALALELLLQDPEGLIDVVIANENLQSGTPLEIDEANVSGTGRLRALLVFG